MSLGVVRGLITLVLLACFVMLVIRTWSRRHSREFDAAARLPLEDSLSPASTASGTETDARSPRS